MHNQKFLNEYFANHWNPGTGRAITNHLEIIKKIKQEEWLLDVGCGKNPFKILHARTVGIDPAFKEADYFCTIENFEIKDFKFDVATCLGSINFGTEEIIDRQISKVVSLLKPKSRIYWRLNPGRNDHDSELCHQIMFFPWTHEILSRYADKHKYTQTNEILEQHPTRPRLYAEWHR